MNFFRNKAPFILLAISFLATILDLFSLLDSVYLYLGDLFGYSLFTNFFMLSVYFNKKYCNATKITVLGLMILNVFNLISHSFEFYSITYNLILEITIIFITLTYFKNGTTNNRG